MEEEEEEKKKKKKNDTVTKVMEPRMYTYAKKTLLHIRKK